MKPVVTSTRQSAYARNTIGINNAVKTPASPSEPFQGMDDFDPFTEHSQSLTPLQLNRKERILHASLHLFAERGYENTPTQLIAAEAGVSEALIYKHFASKEKLLLYIIKDGYRRIVEHNRGMLRVDDPLAFIHKIIDLPRKLVTEEPDFWKLQSRLTEIPVFSRQHERFLQPVYELLTRAFANLGYSDPKKETEYLMMLIEALWKFQIAKSGDSINDLLSFIKTKYYKPANKLAD